MTIIESLSKKLPEANIQAEIKKRLDNIGINNYLEIRYNVEGLEYNLVADITICNEDNDVLGFIETKSHKNPSNYTYKRYDPNDDVSSKQLKKYQATELPVYLVGTIDSIPGAIDYAKELAFLE